MTNRTRQTGEFETIDRYFAPLTKGFEGAQGLANDTANLTISDGYDAVVTLDTMVAGVHFLPNDPADTIARKLLRVNLSDLASSGAVPKTYFLSLSLPSEISNEWIACFTDGLAADQKIFDVTLGGGDTTSTPGPLSLSLTAIGEAPRDKTIVRSGASAGEDIYVSGTIGDAALALAIIETEGPEQALKMAPALVSRYRIPEPRVLLGPRIRDLATACIDISDGLIADIGHICRASAVGAEITASNVPLSDEGQRILSQHPDWSERPFTGGDDYELLFTVCPEDTDKVSALSGELKLPLTRIGRIISGDSPKLLADSGEAISLAKTGWRHF